MLFFIGAEPQLVYSQFMNHFYKYELESGISTVLGSYIYISARSLLVENNIAEVLDAAFWPGWVEDEGHRWLALAEVRLIKPPTCMLVCIGAQRGELLFRAASRWCCATSFFENEATCPNAVLFPVTWVSTRCWCSCSVRGSSNSPTMFFLSFSFQYVAPVC